VAAPRTQDRFDRRRHGCVFVPSVTYYDGFAATAAVLISRERGFHTHVVKREALPTHCADGQEDVDQSSTKERQVDLCQAHFSISASMRSIASRLVRLRMNHKASSRVSGRPNSASSSRNSASLIFAYCGVSFIFLHPPGLNPSLS
jgi:hypothetical protein